MLYKVHSKLSSCLYFSLDSLRDISAYLVSALLTAEIGSHSAMEEERADGGDC